MPSGIIWQGQTRRVPNVYAEITADDLNTNVVNFGNMAVVGEFPQFEQFKPFGFTSARAVRNFSDDVDLATIAQKAFSPSLDDRIPGGANTLVFLNVASTSKARAYLQNSVGLNAILLESRLSGSGGNGTFVELLTSTTDPTTWCLKVTQNGTTESIDRIGGSGILEVWVDSPEIASSAFAASPTQWRWDWVTVDYAFPAPGVGATQQVNLTPTQIQFSASVALEFELKHGGSGAPAEAITIQVTGVNQLGVPDSETVSFSSGAADSDTVNLTKFFAEITAIDFETADTAFNGSINFAGRAFDIDPTQFASVGAIFNLLQTADSRGFRVAALTTSLSSIPAAPSGSTPGGVDVIVDTDVVGSAEAAVVTANTTALVNAINTRSAFLSASLELSTNVPITVPQSRTLVGAVSGTALASDWVDGLKKLENEDIQIVVGFTDLLVNHQALVNHCRAAATAGYERNAYSGAASNLTPTQLLSDYILKLDSQYLSISGQDAVIFDVLGRRVQKPTYWHSLLVAGMQAGSSIATPLTRKRPDLIDTVQNWTPGEDDEQVIANGILATSVFGGQIVCLRSVTTHVRNDNPFYSEISTFESMQTSVRDARNELQIQIGNPVFEGDANRIKILLEEILRRQVTARFIRAWRNVTVQDLGDYFAFEYEVAPIEPLNFITLEGRAKRF